ncbi:uncharacterized protein LOC130654963 [Hydractinia symbiolongicarpus]|uniref:uncharacterized protein LOC130654963 n=1 Tax=Hydractinia symbiolongicarpus TaxID=13093 RepID=UPI0025517EF4|nr:uncharacterized protein LOC130654963 [Hydractinia symbiolongicarpus]
MLCEENHYSCGFSYIRQYWCKLEILKKCCFGIAAYQSGVRCINSTDVTQNDAGDFTRGGILPKYDPRFFGSRRRRSFNSRRRYVSSRRRYVRSRRRYLSSRRRYLSSRRRYTRRRRSFTRRRRSLTRRRRVSRRRRSFTRRRRTMTRRRRTSRRRRTARRRRRVTRRRRRVSRRRRRVMRRRRTARRRRIFVRRRRRFSRRRTSCKTGSGKCKSPNPAYKIIWKAEGNNNPKSIYFSRRAHVPPGGSGLTIGRGYDMKERSKEEAYNDLIKAGVPKEQAEKLSGGAKLQGNAAKNYLEKNLKGIVISEKAQEKLFNIAVEEKVKDAKRIFTKPDVVNAYGKADWNKLNPAIKGTVVDMLYRGDYKPSTRKFLQKAIVDNDLKKFTEIMSNERVWDKYGVPPDRFKRRKEFLENAVKEQKKEEKRRKGQIPRL